MPPLGLAPGGRGLVGRPLQKSAKSRSQSKGVATGRDEGGSQKPQAQSSQGEQAESTQTSSLPSSHQAGGGPVRPQSESSRIKMPAPEPLSRPTKSEFLGVLLLFSFLRTVSAPPSLDSFLR